MCDYDPPALFTSKVVVTRTEHSCDECGTPIKVGTRAWHYKGLSQDAYDGWFEGHRCPVCSFMTGQGEDNPFHACPNGGDIEDSDRPATNRESPWWQEVAAAIEQVRPPDPSRIQRCGNDDCFEMCYAPIHLGAGLKLCARCALEPAHA